MTQLVRWTVLALLCLAPTRAWADLITISHDSTYTVTVAYVDMIEATVDGFVISGFPHFHLFSGTELATFFDDAQGIRVRRIDGAPYRVVSMDLDIRSTLELPDAEGHLTTYDTAPRINGTIKTVSGTMVFGPDEVFGDFTLMLLPDFPIFGRLFDLRQTLQSFTIETVPEPAVLWLLVPAIPFLVRLHRRRSPT